MTLTPVVVWFRRDLRLEDHAALSWASETRRPVIPLFVLDDAFSAMGAASKWRLEHSLKALDEQLRGLGSRLILRQGAAHEVVPRVMAETGAQSIAWSRAYDPASVTRDTKIKADLVAQGIDVQSFAGHVLFEPWSVETGTGSFYKVYTPFWKSVRDRVVPSPLPQPVAFTTPAVWPATDSLTAWRLDRGLGRGADILARHTQAGAVAARKRLTAFTAEAMSRYGDQRDVPTAQATSGLSDHLTWGEISPRICWHVGLAAREIGNPGAEKFLQEVVWRDFAYHLLWHTPQILTQNWRPGWDQFPWSMDDQSQQVMAWKQGRTGVPFVDAAMREMYVTGRMHNRARMVAASFLTKHLLVHWSVGQKWFEECLTDWDPASNAMGWQWVAGCGPDAAPFFRIFNPVSQQEKFDPKRGYVTRWIAEGQARPHPDALSFFDAIPRNWALSPKARYPAPIVDLKEGRARALAAYSDRDKTPPLAVGQNA